MISILKRKPDWTAVIIQQINQQFNNFNRYLFWKKKLNGSSE